MEESCLFFRVIGRFGLRRCFLLLLVFYIDSCFACDRLHVRANVLRRDVGVKPVGVGLWLCFDPHTTRPVL